MAQKDYHMFGAERVGLIVLAALLLVLSLILGLRGCSPDSVDQTPPLVHPLDTIATDASRGSLKHTADSTKSRKKLKPRASTPKKERPVVKPLRRDHLNEPVSH